MLEYKGPKIWTDAEILYEMKFWHEIEERDDIRYGARKLKRGKKEHQGYERLKEKI